MTDLIEESLVVGGSRSRDVESQPTRSRGWECSVGQQLHPELVAGLADLDRLAQRDDSEVLEFEHWIRQLTGR
jgi:hypothetical protein